MAKSAGAAADDDELRHETKLAGTLVQMGDKWVRKRIAARREVSPQVLLTLSRVCINSANIVKTRHLLNRRGGGDGELDYGEI